MKKIPININIYKFSVKNFKQYKQKLLDDIASMGAWSIHTKDVKIHNTDWHLNRDIERPYNRLFFDLIQPFTEEFAKDINGKISFNNYWFQQYKKGDFHTKHSHPGSTWSSVFYIELPKDTQTTFYTNDGNFMVDCYEGDFLIFPAHVCHESKPNQTDERKTIISLNLEGDLYAK